MSAVVIDILGIGECMVELESSASFYDADQFNRRASGDVYNTLVAASKLGCLPSLLTNVAWDGFGKYLVDQFKTYNIDTSLIKTVKKSRNGVYFISQADRGTSDHNFIYYRHDSAACSITPSQIPIDAFEQIRVVYATGVTQALSRSARETVLRAFQMAKKQGCLVCYDPNYREALWGRADEALDALTEVIGYVDVILPSVEDLKPLFNFPDVEKTLEYFRLRGVSLVALKQGADGVTLGFKNWQKHLPAPAVPKVVDTIGAGDAFNGGFLFGLVNAYSLEECAHIGSIVAGECIKKAGPIEGLPDRITLNRLLAQTPSPEVSSPVLASLPVADTASQPQAQSSPESGAEPNEAPGQMVPEASETERIEDASSDEAAATTSTVATQS
ncbi:MAG: sugar kinase [Cyanobacteria bacterium HKST-UBA03]|nr:sugar kinase [Cyanobacteria bacterium HKST-UBA03]